MSRRQRSGTIILCLLMAGVFIWLDRKSQPKPSDLEKYHAKTATVVNVVDGDTIDIDISFDFPPIKSGADSNQTHTRVRLWGVDTPETKEPNIPVQYFGPEATDFTTKLALGKQVTVYLDTPNRTRDKYGRLLAYVKLPDNGFLNEVLVSEGFAYADLRFHHSFYNKYQQLEASARSLKKGLWEKVTREQLPEWLKREKPNLLQSK